MTHECFMGTFAHIVSDYNMGFISELDLFGQVSDLLMQNEEHVPFASSYAENFYGYKTEMHNIALSVIKGEEVEVESKARAKELRASLELPIQSLSIAAMSEEAWTERIVNQWED